MGKGPGARSDAGTTTSGHAVLMLRANVRCGRCTLHCRPQAIMVGLGCGGGAPCPPSPPCTRTGPPGRCAPAESTPSESTLGRREGRAAAQQSTRTSVTDVFGIRMRRVDGGRSRPR
eukprot:4531359-Prymnesium_polylepis.3